jgi:hypothetical protein
VLKYVALASVAIPFRFVLAAITVMLLEPFGELAAYWIMAGGLSTIGVIAASTEEHQEEVAEQKTEETDMQAVVNDATTKR